jgi:predicted O-methyltransferase YrrM
VKISIVTPWAGSTGPALLPDYAAAVQGAEVITVDNASDEATAQGLIAMYASLGGHYLRNTENRGFAAANNQGYSRASGDIIVFLNSDIAAPPGWLRAVAADVKDGALYGPSLQYQLVAGRWLPYLDGWCVAATRATWEWLCWSIVGLNEEGPWDDRSYPGPYWEDNDLCLRALAAGISLIQTAWPVQHKGGQTAGPLVRHAASFEANRATFTARAQRALRDAPTVIETAMQQRYRMLAAQQSDIQHHLPLLYSLAKGNVLELGTRTGVSTAALLAGVEARGGQVISVDIDPNCERLYADHPQWAFWHGSSTDMGLARDITTYAGPFDILFIDTEHTFEMATAELALWGDHIKPGGHILLHDPETFPGVRRAIREFCEARAWPVTFVLPCNGMAVIEVPR